MAPDEEYAADFGSFDGRVWLNAAHQGPLLNLAVEAAQQMLAERRAPHRISDESFLEVPRRLRVALGKLIRVDSDDIILGNSASYGLAMLAAAMPWRARDEVLFVSGEFPATVFPWRITERQGVNLRFFGAGVGCSPEAEEVAAQLNERTRVVCMSWVNSFTGHAIDVGAIARVCRTAGVQFVLNASQGLGARCLDLSETEVDAIVCCGYKWLLGPYATGFAWVRPALRDRLQPPHAYWLPNVWGRDGGMAAYALRDDLGARAFDLFDTANFLNFVPWTATLEYLIAAKPETIAHYDEALTGQLVNGIPRDRFQLLSPADGSRRSTLVVVRPTDGRPPKVVHEALTTAGIDTALREGAIRLSPHLYNTSADIDRTLHVLQH